MEQVVPLQRKGGTKMQRLTERAAGRINYIGKHVQVPGLDCAGNMRVAATREVMQRLADYEDTGLDPEQIKNLLREKQQKN
jgi:hypothetical protein